MLNIQIDNPELEKSIQQTYGDDSQSIANDFLMFIREQRVKQDINISIKQLDEGKGVPLAKAMEGIRSKYE